MLPKVEQCMLLKTVGRFIGVAALFISAPALAGLCQAPFMRDGGQATLVGSGVLRLGADLAFSHVVHTGADRCEARVQGDTTFGLMGLPAGKSALDYWMVVTDGDVVFQRQDQNGKRQPIKGKFDLRMLGLFAYGEPITKAGQTFPPLQFQINMDRKALQADPLIVKTGKKTVGDPQTMDTAAGAQSCWPIRYTRVIEPTQASFNGLVLPIPGMTSAVTDWYCPGVSMVMKQESMQNGVASVVEVTQIN